MRQCITNATIVEGGERFKGSLLIEDGIIADIAREGNIQPRWLSDSGIDETNAEGMLLLPGVIDDHVHNREPGLTHKADMDSETRAAAAGGVTSVFDMPNVVPQTTSLKLLEERYRMAGEKCHVNYAFYLGATADNINDIRNTLFYAGDMKDILTEAFVKKHGKPDVIITDPPRAGMHEDVVNVILNAEPQRIVYVSCNPATQARDLQLLDAKYRVTAIQPVDMFPQTHHVENVVQLKLKD